MPPRLPHMAHAELSDLSAAVGNRIRTLRTARGVSLSALAAITQLGKGTLSELERGHRNPTLDTLFAIATALSVPLGDLLAADDAGPAEHQRTAPGAHGQNLDAELIGRWNEPTETVEVYRMVVRRGRRESRRHLTGVIESITVVHGEISVGGTDAPARLVAGQSHTFRGDQDHLYEGLAERSSTVLVMRYPAAGAGTSGERG